MLIDKMIEALSLELHEEAEVPDSNKYKFHGNGETKKRPPRWQKVFDVVDEFIASDMEIASIDISQVTSEYPVNFRHRLGQSIQTYARKQGVVAKKRGDKVYLIKDKEN